LCKPSTSIMDVLMAKPVKLSKRPARHISKHITGRWGRRNLCETIG
jgi:hypothetical protein